MAEEARVAVMRAAAAMTVGMREAAMMEAVARAVEMRDLVWTAALLHMPKAAQRRSSSPAAAA